MVALPLLGLVATVIMLGIAGELLRRADRAADRRRPFTLAEYVQMAGTTRELLARNLIRDGSVMTFTRPASRYGDLVALVERSLSVGEVTLTKSETPAPTESLGSLADHRADVWRYWAESEQQRGRRWPFRTGGERVVSIDPGAAAAARAAPGEMTARRRDAWPIGTEQLGSIQQRTGKWVEGEAKVPPSDQSQSLQADPRQPHVGEVSSADAKAAERAGIDVLHEFRLREGKKAAELVGDAGIRGLISEQRDAEIAATVVPPELVDELRELGATKLGGKRPGGYNYQLDRLMMIGLVRRTGEVNPYYELNTRGAAWLRINGLR